MKELRISSGFPQQRMIRRIKVTNQEHTQNCKQLVVFTKHRLQVKLFSLDCTHMLWKIDRPISDEILVRPGLNNTIWSLVVNSGLPVSSDAAPVIYHFYNEGSISSLLYKFKFSTNASHTLVNWSGSGKWLCNLNSIDCLFGFDFANL